LPSALREETRARASDDRGPAEARAVIVSSLARARVSSRKADGKPLLCP
jgi:hypothetical protein